MIKNTSGNPRLSWLFEGNPEAIDRQEKEGQKELVASSIEEVQQLPARGNGCDAREVYQKLGFEVISQSNGDPLFLDVKMKNGFHVQPTDHPMWSDLVDNKGRARASIFYKAAFYDRDAFINPLKTRYNVERRHVRTDKQYESGYHRRNNEPILFDCTDNGVVIFSTPGLLYTEIYDEEKHVEWWEGYEAAQNQQKEIAINYLNDSYPDWIDPMAYWDEPSKQ